MQLNDAIRLLANSTARLIRFRDIQDNFYNRDRRVMPSIFRREAWINFKRSWDVLRTVWLVDKRTRISARQALRRLMHRKYPENS